MTSATTQTPLRIAIVGAGRVGPVLGAAFAQAGHRITGITARSPQGRDRAGALLPGTPVKSVEHIAADADLVLLAVSDDALAAVAHRMAAAPGQIVAHVSGAHGLDVLAPLAAAGAITMAIHPAMTFTGTSLDVARLRGCAFAVTAPAAMAPLAHALVREVGGEPVTVAAADRPAYHAALSHAANHTVTLISQARRILAAIGQADPGATLQALVHASVEGALRSGDDALTGPVLRGDAGTIRAHLVALAELGEPDIEATYRTLATTTAARVEERGILPPEDLADVRDALIPAPEVCTTKAHLRAALAARPGRRAVVMTMGALHGGHLALVRAARDRADVVVASVFVNPLQFGPGEDFDSYPRDLPADVAMLAEAGVDVVFAPEPAEMYPREPLVRIDPGPVAATLEGKTRPTHFAGVLQVVTKLLNLTQPDVAVFGEKDAQQLALVRTLVADLDIPVEILAVPIEREETGLAKSSRNAYLDDAERAHALALSGALGAAAQALAAGEARTAGDAERIAREHLEADDGVRVDYVAVRDAETFGPPGPDTRHVVLAVAAWVGATRLIDNRRLDLTSPPVPGTQPQ